MSEWIRCSEQMPEKNTMVIVACYGSDIVTPQDGETVWQTRQRQNKDIKRVTLGFIDDDGYWNGADYMPMMISPTYWQPLPEVPDYEADPDDVDNGLTWDEIFNKIAFEQRCCNDRWDETYTVAYQSDINDMRTVNITHCKDCMYYNGGTDGYGVCTRDLVKDTDYCSRGKERDDEKDDI